MSSLQFISNSFIKLADGSMIQDNMDGVSCSHNNYKKLCATCMIHLSKDFKIRCAFYELNKNYLVNKFNTTKSEDGNA